MLRLQDSSHYLLGLNIFFVPSKAEFQLFLILIVEKLLLLKGGNIGFLIAQRVGDNETQRQTVELPKAREFSSY
jgi:hypothetical protein